MRVVTEHVPSVRSIALGFWVRTGSRDETVEQAGISHLLEHLLFKGTERFSSLEIDEAFDGMGAEVNAGTGKETTSVYSRFLDHHLERAFDLLQDMVLRPAYPDIDSERQVVIEEIAMYEDEPADKVHDVLAGAVFGDHPLGRPIIGRAEVIASVPVPEIAGYHDSHYTAPNIVVAAAGNLEHDRIVGLVEGALEGPQRGRQRPDRAGAGAGGRGRARQLPAEGHRAVPRLPGRPRACRAPTTGASSCACSTRSWAARPRPASSRRCARSAAWPTPSTRSPAITSTPGRSGSTSGTRPDRVGEALEAIGGELRRLQDEEVPAEELERAKENVKGRTTLSMESTLARMNRLGSSVLTGVPLLSLDEVLQRSTTSPPRTWPRWRASCSTPIACRPPVSAPTRRCSAARSST